MVASGSTADIAKGDPAVAMIPVVAICRHSIDAETVKQGARKEGGADRIDLGLASRGVSTVYIGPGIAQ